MTLAFGAPQTITQILLEVEEPEFARTQELHLSLSCDGGRTYRELLKQEYDFSGIRGSNPDFLASEANGRARNIAE